MILFFSILINIMLFNSDVNVQNKHNIYIVNNNKVSKKINDIFITKADLNFKTIKYSNRNTKYRKYSNKKRTGNCSIRFISKFNIFAFQTINYRFTKFIFSSNYRFSRFSRAPPIF